MTGSELSIWHLIGNASVIVKFVMLVLLTASIWSWTLIFQRIACIKKSRHAMRQFERDFWSGTDLADFYRKLSRHTNGSLAAGHIFCAGFKDFLRMQKSGHPTTEAIIEAVQRAMRVAFMRESDRLDNGLPWLATIGSVSPYVGLFGTVWGIMTSFQALAGVQQATLAMVAPGISEALIATALGLLVAIPAVVAYNRFNAHVERLLNDYENFQDEFAGILHRQLHSHQSVSQ